jgi:hypothetical protein
VRDNSGAEENTALPVVTDCLFEWKSISVEIPLERAGELYLEYVHDSKNTRQINGRRRICATSFYYTCSTVR